MARAVALVLLAATLVACGGGAGGDGALRFLVWGDAEELRAYRELANAYDGDVQLAEASDRADLIARLSSSLAGGSPPDLFLINYRYYAQFAARDAIEPVTERLETSAAFEPGDFYEQALDAFRWRGEQLCLPQNASSLAVYYNVDLFRGQGLPEPADDWTWGDLLAAASRLTLDARGNPTSGGDPDRGGTPAAIYGLALEPSIIRLAPLVWSAGGELVDDPAAPTRLALDSPVARAALDELLSLGPSGVVPPDVEVEAEDDETRFANGRVAMLLSSRRSVPAFRTIRDFEWDVAPLPPLRTPAGVLHSDAYCLTRASGRKDEAWRFVEFALGPEGQRILARTGRTVPSLRKVAESEAFLDPAQPPSRSRVFLDALEHVRPLPVISTWPEIEDATEPILELGYYHGRDAGEVARQLSEATAPLFARGERP